MLPAAFPLRLSLNNVNLCVWTPRFRSSRPPVSFVPLVSLLVNRCKSLLIDSKSFPVASRCFPLLPAAFLLLPAAFRLKKCKSIRLDPRLRWSRVSLIVSRCKSLLLDSKSFPVASRCFLLLPAAFRTNRMEIYASGPPVSFVRPPGVVRPACLLAS